MDDHSFLSVRATASMFGKSKLKASPLASFVREDLDLLRLFGAVQRCDVRQGLEPRIRRLFYAVRERVTRDATEMNRYLPVLEYVASDYPQAWLHLAEVQRLIAGIEGLSAARRSVERFLESVDGPTHADGWRRMAELCGESDDVRGELEAWAAFAEERKESLDDVSHAANQVNRVVGGPTLELTADEKRSFARTLIPIFAPHRSCASGTEISRLAWLYRNSGNTAEAKRCTEEGLKKYPDNVHLLRLAERWNLSTDDAAE
jgi:hypothetical protein